MLHNHLALRKWCYTPLQRDFALDPIIPPFDFHFESLGLVIFLNISFWFQIIGLKGVMLLILHPILELGASVC
jgi:hypothetical protein